MEVNGARVVTTKKLAEMFGVSQTRLHIHFMKNKNQFKEGCHYYVLSGSEMNDYKKQYPNRKELKHTGVLYVWKANGAYLLAQLLKGEAAWRGYCQCIYYFYAGEEEVQNSLQIVKQKVEQMKQAVK